MDLIECKRDGINRHPWELSRVHCLIKETKKYFVGKTILDIGCGDSYLDHKLIEEVSDIKNIYGIDGFLTTTNPETINALVRWEIFPENFFCVFHSQFNLRKIAFHHFAFKIVS